MCTVLYGAVPFTSVTFLSIDRPKHPTKVHVWAGISRRGRTGICIFEGIMNKELYAEILEKTLLPFTRRVFPDGYNFMQDNDPKHTSKYVREWMESNGVVWWKTPPESPDLNPIEDLWHELKESIRRQVKPKSKDELIQGIQSFWRTVDAIKCNKYINHLYKVLPKVIELNGGATGY